MTSAHTRNGWIASWFTATALLTAILAVVEMYVPNESLYEMQAIAALERSADETADLQIVVLGDSLGRNAFGDGPEAELALQRVGLDANVTNLSTSGGTFRHFERIRDDIVELSPDIVIVQLEALLRNDVPIRRSLPTRIRLRRSVQPTNLPGPVCLGFRPGETVDALLERVEQRFARTDYHDAEAIDLAERLADFGGRVILVGLPLSEQLEKDGGLGREAFRSEMAERLTSQENVLLDDDYSLPAIENYCDFSHLEAVGRQRFLSAWAVNLHELVG